MCDTSVCMNTLQVGPNVAKMGSKILWENTGMSMRQSKGIPSSKLNLWQQGGQAAQDNSELVFHWLNLFPPFQLILSHLYLLYRFPQQNLVNHYRVILFAVQSIDFSSFQSSFLFPCYYIIHRGASKCNSCLVYIKQNITIYTMYTGYIYHMGAIVDTPILVVAPVIKTRHLHILVLSIRIPYTQELCCTLGGRNMERDYTEGDRQFSRPTALATSYLHATKNIALSIRICNLQKL